MINILSDTNKIVKIKDSITAYSLKIEDKINRLLRKLKTFFLLPVNIYKQLYVTGSGPGISYGALKIHKANFSTDFPFRPILLLTILLSMH